MRIKFYVIAGLALMMTSNPVFADQEIVSPFADNTVLFVNTGTSADVTVMQNEVTGIVAAKWKLNVRISPWGTIIDGFKPGREVSIVAREGDWYRIRYGSGFAYVHTSLINTDGSDSAQIPSDNVAQSASSQSSTDNPSTAGNTNASTPSATAITASGGINGPAIPAELTKGLAAAKKSEWARSHKCLQFAGTIAAKAGATPGKAAASQPQTAYPADKSLRGYQINDLGKAVDAGLLKPGMLIHVKIHYDRDPAYHVGDDAHHWFVYMGKNSAGVPMFADNTHSGNLQTAQQVYSNMKGWSNSKKYGDSKYGYVPRVTAIHDPFADKR
ncbi:MAG: SH3 domain-containing protein [Candidatus Riflebacteria bacterium]|nr:SH3 domain-containing protein [Candidatus Riflebacteria bacterium]